VRGKFVYKPPRNPPPLSYDRTELNALLISPNGEMLSASPNGCALQNNYESSAQNMERLSKDFNSDNKNFLKSLICLLLEALSSKNSDMSHAALIQSLNKFVSENGSENTENQ
jgi:hypothetical protein